MRREALLGPFRLEEPLGKGAMATVWRARHMDGPLAAVKVMAPGPGRDGAVLREAKAIAALDHPSIVPIHDAGLVPDDAQGLHPGTPWLAMELSELGDLHRHEPGDWPTLRRGLLDLLEGLAHAHARGILHLDVKPQNVLRYPGGRWKLADFGIAHRVGRDDASWLPTGTPRYMAPEQFGHRGRGLTPATDLYAVGCLAWLLTTGSVPFTGPTATVMMAHQLMPLPTFRPRCPVPDGLEDWLRWMLAKSPGARFTCAADARWRLLQLGPARGTFEARTNPADREATVVLRAPEPGAGPGAPTAHDPPPPPIAPPVDKGVLPSPATWPPLRGTSAVLLRLRQPRLVGRRGEQETLWRSLRDVGRSGRPRLVVVSGPPGAGSSRLIDDLAIRAAELGSGQGLFCRHNDPTGLADGPVGMARGVLRAGLLRDEALSTWLAEVLPAMSEADRSELKQLLQAGAAVTTPRANAVLTRWIAQKAKVRPVVLAVHDLHRSASTIELVRRLLHAAAPVMVVATASATSLEGGPLSDLVGHPRAGQLRLGRLEPHHERALLRAVLDLSDSLVHRITRRSGGLPGLALWLLREALVDGNLEEGPEGWTLRPGRDLASRSPTGVPTAIREHPAALRPLQVLAVLGMDVDTALWDAACGRAEVSLPAEALSLYERWGLLRPRPPNGVTLSHPGLRQALLEGLEISDREALHAACAEAMADMVGRHSPSFVLHALLGGRPEAAVGPLHPVLERLLGLGAYEQAQWILDALGPHGAALPRETVHLAKLLRIRLLLARGHVAMAREELRAFDTETPELPATLQRRAARLLATAATELGDYEEALGALTEGLATTRDADDESCSPWLVSRAEVHFRLKRPKEALSDARQALETACSDSEAAQALRALGILTAVLSPQSEEAHRHFRASLAAYQRAGDRAGVAGVMNELGGRAQDAGDLDQAEQLYRRAAILYAEIGHRDEHLAKLNLAMLHSTREEWQALYDACRTALPHFSREGRMILEAAACSGVFAGLVGMREWTLAQAPLERLEAFDSLPQASKDLLEQAKPTLVEGAPALADRVSRLLKPAASYAPAPGDCS